MSKRLSPIFSLLLVMMLVLSACGGAAPAAEPVSSAPLAEAVAAPTEAPAEPTAAPVAEAMPAVDVTGIVGEYLAGIPDGYMNVGKIDAFKEAIAAGAILIDVRETSEYEAGHIPGAVNVPLRTLTKNLDKIPTDMPVFVYCASGHRAGMALSSLRILGYDNVKAYSPGWKGWTAANEEVSMEMVEAATYPVKEVNAEALAAVSEFLTNIPEGWLSLGTPEKLQEVSDVGAQLVDVREPSEFEGGAIPNALSIPIRTIGANLDQIPMDTPVVVYCASGFRAALSTAALQIMGYTNVRAFPPSYAGWEAAQ